MRKTLIFWALPVLLLAWTPSALSAEPDFIWQGNKGYQVEFYLSSPEGNQSERFIFSAPRGEPLAQYPKSLTNPYFQLHLSPPNRCLTGDLDIGGDKPGEYFLKGRVGRTLELVKILGPGREVVLDRGRELRQAGERRGG